MARFTIDAAHTDVAFSAKHMMVTTVRGRFPEVEGWLDLEPADPAASGGEIVVGAASLSTGFDARDQHLRSADLFDVETYPHIRFVATSVTARDDDHEVAGDLTIRDVTRPVRFDVEFHGFYTGMTGARRAALTARTTINRRDWGLNWNVALEAGRWLVSDEVRLEIEVAAEEQAVAEVETEAEITQELAAA